MPSRTFTDAATGEALGTNVPNPGETPRVLGNEDVAPDTTFAGSPQRKSASKKASAGSGQTIWWFCLNDAHPRDAAYNREPYKNPSRLFQALDDGGCPRCPECLDFDGNPMQVNAVPTDEGVIPDLRQNVQAN